MSVSFQTPPDLLDGLDVLVKADAPLGALTWYRVGGRAAVLASPRGPEALSELVGRCRKRRVPVYVLGAGANLLVRERGVDGVVVRLDDAAFKQLRIDGRAVTAGAGVDLFKLVPASARAGLDGLVQVAGIPATIGGAVRMNAGGAFGEIGSTVRRVRVMSEAGEVYDRHRDELEFGYRHSNLDEPFILEAEFELAEDDPAAMMKRYKEIYLYKKNSQPMGEKSAGCCFKNPPPAEAGGPGVPAGKLIDQAGLKGFAVGGASVSEVHANFVLAKPNQTTADDVLAVIEHVEAVVEDRFGVRLQRELIVW